MSDNIISERITAAREQLGITKAEASRRLNLSKSATVGMNTAKGLHQCKH